MRACCHLLMVCLLAAEHVQEGEEGAAPAGDDSTPASRVRERYERMLRENRRAAEDGLSPERVKEQEHAAAAAVARTNFRGSISSAFAPYLQ